MKRGRNQRLSLSTPAFQLIRDNIGKIIEKCPDFEIEECKVDNEQKKTAAQIKIKLKHKASLKCTMTLYQTTNSVLVNGSGIEPFCQEVLPKLKDAVKSDLEKRLGRHVKQSSSKSMEDKTDERAQTLAVLSEQINNPQDTNRANQTELVDAPSNVADESKQKIQDTSKYCNLLDGNNNDEGNSCPFCPNESNNQMILCNNCQHWIHYLCSQLPDDQIAVYENEVEKEYQCKNCVGYCFGHISDSTIQNVLSIKIDSFNSDIKMLTEELDRDVALIKDLNSTNKDKDKAIKTFKDNQKSLEIKAHDLNLKCRSQEKEIKALRQHLELIKLNLQTVEKEKLSLQETVMNHEQMNKLLQEEVEKQDQHNKNLFLNEEKKGNLHGKQNIENNTKYSDVVKESREDIHRIDKDCDSCKAGGGIQSICRTCSVSMCKSCTLAHKLMHCFEKNSVEPLFPNQTQGIKEKAGKNSMTLNKGNREEESYTKETSVPQIVVGHVIGRQGWRIKKIQYESNTKIENTHGSVFRITGHQNNITKAIEMIHRVVNEVQMLDKSTEELKNKYLNMREINYTQSRTKYISNKQYKERAHEINQAEPKKCYFYFNKGHCRYGLNCRYSHEETRPRSAFNNHISRPSDRYQRVEENFLTKPLDRNPSVNKKELMTNMLYQMMNYIQQEL